MKQNQNDRADKRAAALRDNLKRRKAKIKSEKAAQKEERQDSNAKAEDK